MIIRQVENTEKYYNVVSFEELFKAHKKHDLEFLSNNFKFLCIININQESGIKYVT